MQTILWVHDQEYEAELHPIIHESPIPIISAHSAEQAMQQLDKVPTIGVVFYQVSRSAQADSAQRLKQRLMRKGKLITLVYLVQSFDQVPTQKAIEWGGDEVMIWPSNDSLLNTLSRLTAVCHVHQRLEALHTTNRQLVNQQAQASEELKVVERVFDNVINRPRADLNHVRTYMSPMARFNGDLCLVLGSPSGDTYVLLGDFTGHGLSAAIGSLPVSDIFYAMVPKGAEVDEIAREINRKLLNVLPDSMFLCAIILRLNRSHTRLQVWGGGMYDLLVLSERDSEQALHIERLPSQCMPLGVLTEDEFESNVIEFTLGNNMRLFAHSDGLIEAENTRGEQLGESRLERLLSQSSALLKTDESLIDRVLAAFQSFVGHSNPTDDVSMVEISCGKALDVWESKRLPDSCNEADLTTCPAVPWHFAAVLFPQDLRNSEVSTEIMELLKACRLDESSLGLVHTVFSELFNNALEHGLLKLSSAQKASAQGFEDYYHKRQVGLAALDSGEIRINLHIVPSIDQPDQHEVEMTISDTGDGYEPNLHSVDDDLAHGRGLFLLKSLCRRIEMSNRGRTVTVSLPITLVA